MFAFGQFLAVLMYIVYSYMTCVLNSSYYLAGQEEKKEKKISFRADYPPPSLSFYRFSVLWA